jgi:hypothetical protein
VGTFTADSWSDSGDPVASITAARIISGGSATATGVESGAEAGRSGRNLIRRSFRIGVAIGTHCCLV